MANINVTIRVDKALKAQADELFLDLGISTNAAINMFLKQAVRVQGIPFEVKREANTILFAENDALTALSERIIDENLVAYEELAK